MSDSPTTAPTFALPAPTYGDPTLEQVQLAYGHGRFGEALAVLAPLLSASRVKIAAALWQAVVLREIGRFEEAIAIYRRILNAHPERIEAKAGLAYTLFLAERWDEAWPVYDVRFKLGNLPQVTRRGADGAPTSVPRWRSGPPPKSLLITGEQGLGDTIQFARFLEPLAATGARFIVTAQPQLHGLLGTLDVALDLRDSSRSGQVRSTHWAPLLDLPMALALAPTRFAPRIPYLRAPPERVAFWRKSLPTAERRIGIAWKGTTPTSAAPLAVFAPLVEIPGVRLVALQIGEALGDIAKVDFGRRIVVPDRSLSRERDAFLETAAMIEAVDAVVTIDTSIAHLAGALGRPVYVLLKRLGADWRWGWMRETTPWYPTMRLIRQGVPGDWAEPVGRVLRALVGGAARGGALT